MMLSFSSVKLSNGGLGEMQDENPYVHFRVKYVAQHFSPKMGSFLSIFLVK